MTDSRSIVICGLPASGKTTFLAALWHLVTSRELPTQLVFESLRNGDSSYLNEIAAKWRNALVQERTQIGEPVLVSMNLLDARKVPLRLTFPDVSGELYERMWSDRECDSHLADLLRNRSGLVLFVHSDRIEPPSWVVDLVALSKRLGLPVEEGKPIAWNPHFAPTQVRLVDVLQHLSAPPLNVKTERLVIVLSAWDKVEPEGRKPAEFLAERMPLLHQYLTSNRPEKSWRVFGVSAQGGEYEKPPINGGDKLPSREVMTLRELNIASERIRVYSGSSESHDLTEPIAWLTA